MKKRSKYLLVGVGVLVVALGIYLFWPRTTYYGHKTLQQWQAQLNSGDAEQRRLAAESLAYIGPPAKAALPALRGCLTDPEAKVRIAAALAVWRINADPAVIATLREAWQDKEQKWNALDALARMGDIGRTLVLEAFAQDDLRNQAAQRLIALKPHDKESVAKLVSYLAQPATGEAAANVLSALGPPGEAALREACGHANVQVHLQAARVLWRASKHPEAVKAYRRTLQEPDSADQDRALALEELWPAAPEAVAVVLLARLAQEKDPAARLQRATALAALGEAGEPAIPILAEILLAASREAASLDRNIPTGGNWPESFAEKSRKATQTAEQAARALAKLGGKTVAPLVEVLTAKDTQTRYLNGSRLAILEALGTIGPPAKSAGTVLEPFLTHENERQRVYAAVALRSIAKDRQAIPVLLKAGAYSNGENAEVALQALTQAAAEEATVIPALIKALDPTKDSRGLDERLIIYALGELGPAAGAAVPKLTGLLEQHHFKGEVARASILALEQIQGKGNVDVPLLLKAFVHGNASIKADAERFLLHVGPDAVPALAEGLTSADVATRRLVASLLPLWATADVVPALTAALADRDTETRSSIARALGHVGAAAKPAVPALEKLLASEQETTRRGVLATALVRIEPANEPGADALLALLRDPAVGWQIRNEAGSLLAQRRYQPTVVVPILIDRLCDEAPAARSGSARALGAYDADAVDAVPRLVEMLHDPNPPSVLAAAEALWQIEQHTASVSSMARLVKERAFYRFTMFEDTPAYAAKSLGKIGSNAKDAVPVLLEVLADPGVYRALTMGEEALRPAAQQALRQIDPAALEKAQ